MNERDRCLILPGFVLPFLLFYPKTIGKEFDNHLKTLKQGMRERERWRNYLVLESFQVVGHFRELRKGNRNFSFAGVDLGLQELKRSLISHELIKNNTCFEGLLDLIHKEMSLFYNNLRMRLYKTLAFI